MENISVPVAALRNQYTFQDWYERMAYQLFHTGDNPPRFEISHSEEEKIKALERILVCINYVYNDSADLIDYKNKKRKHNCSKINVISTAAMIILSYWKITYKELGKLLGVHHTTIVYYLHRHSGSCKSRDYKEKYFKVINLLEHEKTIPTLTGKKDNSKLLVSSLLSRIQP